MKATDRRLPLVALLVLVVGCGGGYPAGKGPGADGGGGGSGGSGPGGGGTPGGTGGTGGTRGPQLACSLDASEPCAPVDFGAVGVGTIETRRVRICNAGDAPTGPLEVHVTPGPFETSGWVAAPGTLAPGACAEAEVSFVPNGRSGLVQGTFTVGDSAHRVEVELRGEGGHAEFRCNPEPIDFGWVVVEESRDAQFTCVNHSRFGGVLSVLAWSPADGESGRTFAPSGPDTVVVEPGQPQTFVIRFRPGVPGPAFGEAQVSHQLTGGFLPVATIELTGVGTELEVSCPAEVDLGSAPVGGTSLRQFVCGNAASRDWLLSDLRLTAASDPAFEFDPVARVQLPAHGLLGFELAFAPTRVGTAGGTLRFRTDHPEQPEIVIRLRGEGSPR